jgi:hypothetical protein
VVAAPADQVDLTAASQEACPQNPEATASQVVGGQPLAALP